MELNNFCKYLKNPLAEPKTRVMLIPPGECWTTLWQFYGELGAVDLYLSKIIGHASWIPMPNEVFKQIKNAMADPSVKDRHCVVHGLSGYLSLLTDQDKYTAIARLRDWVEESLGQEAVCFLCNDAKLKTILKGAFHNPRYQQKKQLIEINSTRDTSHSSVERKPLTFVNKDFEYLLPSGSATLQEFLKHTETYPYKAYCKPIVIASDGKEVAGLSAEMIQVASIRDFAFEFYGVTDSSLSEEALKWMCERAKNSVGNSLVEVTQKHFFTDRTILQDVLCIFDKLRGEEREVYLWLLKKIAPAASYIKQIVSQEEITADNFRSAYVACNLSCIVNLDSHIKERSEAIIQAGVKSSEAGIRLFVERHKEKTTSLFAPWLNCNTSVEKAELLRRCREDNVVSRVVLDVYPELSYYLNEDRLFEDRALEDYFKEYRELKVRCTLSPDFFVKAQQAQVPDIIQMRDAIVQKYATDKSCALLVIDAMGAEWLPMLIAMATRLNVGVESFAVGRANLPTSTQFNQVAWPESSRKLPDIKRFDNIAHKGVEAYETRTPEENLTAALSIIGDEVLPRIADGLTRFERVLVTADHGSSRLAVLASRSTPKLAKTLNVTSEVNISDRRYCTPLGQVRCPSELEETLCGDFWVVRGYNKMPKKGGGNSFELHGGATLEERLVPVVVFSKAGQFDPQSKSTPKPQLIEDDDFDI